MLFFNDKGKLFEKKEISFKLEKDIQTLTEKNLKTLFGLTFLQTEFSIESFRFDTVAFDEENNAFIIIEYKRGKNDSLVDQGYAYLYTLLDRKAEFVLLYNEKLGESRGVKDFAWDQTRIIFISPKFTNYQKNATSFINMPFMLYEIKQFEGGLVFVNKINQNKEVSVDKSNPIMVDKKVDKVSKEIIVYTEQYHIQKSSANIEELYYVLKEKIMALDGVKIQPQKLYIAFKTKTNFCDVVLYKKTISIFINIKSGLLDDPSKMAESVVDIGHWGNGDYRVSFNSYEDIDYVMFLIKQAYKNN